MPQGEGGDFFLTHIVCVWLCVYAILYLVMVLYIVLFFVASINAAAAAASWLSRLATFLARLSWRGHSCRRRRWLSNVVRVIRVSLLVMLWSVLTSLLRGVSTADVSVLICQTPVIIYHHPLMVLACAEWWGETDNQATTPFGHCPSMAFLPVRPHCLNATRNRCQELENWEETNRTPSYCFWRLSSKIRNPITSVWMNQLTWLRIVHSGDRCLRLALRMFSGACQKRRRKSTGTLPTSAR